MRNKFSIMGIEISPIYIVLRSIIQFNNINSVIRTIFVIVYVIDCLYETYYLIILFRSEKYKIRKI